MITTEDLDAVIGGTAYSLEGDKLGTIGNVYVDDETGQPQFLSVTTGLFGTNQTFVPAAEAELHGDRVTVPFAKDAVKEAPHVTPEEGHLDPADERRIFDFYGLQYSVNPDYGTPPEEPPRMMPGGPIPPGEQEKVVEEGTAGRPRLRRYAPPGPPLNIADDRTR